MIHLISNTSAQRMARFFHPSDKIRAKWPNENKRQLVNVLVIGEGQRFVNRKNQWCYIVRIPEIDDGSEFHIVKKSFMVDVAHAQPFLGETSRKGTQQNQPAAMSGAVNELWAAGCNIVTNIGGNLEGDLNDCHHQGITVDDDNEPAPENIPAPNLRNKLDPNTGLNEGQSWGWNGICYCKTMTLMKEKATFHHNWKPHSKSFLEVLLQWLPVKWIGHTIIDATNESLKALKEA